MNHAYGSARTGYGRFGFMLPGGTESRLRAEAQGQINAALRGLRIRSIVEAGPSVTMLTAPAHGDGAALRAAYWLAVSARLTGSPDLIQAAQTVYAKVGWGFWSTPPDIGATLADAERLAGRAGRTDVAAILNGMRRGNEVTTAQSQWNPRDLLPWPLRDPNLRGWTLRGWTLGSIVAVSAAALVAAFLLAPAPSARAMSRAVSYVGAREKARRIVQRAKARRVPVKATRQKRLTHAEEARRYLESTPWDEEMPVWR